jgi:NAD(P)H-dependent flavin oxidoreductase YrpB (nitropropane dioxygenase family)
MNTRFTELLKCSAPIQLAAMPGVVTPELAIAVAEAGGLGMVSAMRTTPERMANLLDSIRGRTRNPVGVNFLMPFLDRDVLTIAAERAPLVEFFYGDPDEALVELVHSKGALVCWQAGSVDEAVAAARKGCDLIVAQGCEAGGHVRGASALRSLVPEVVRAVQVPVLAAGGLASAADVSEVLAMGAAGVRIGTRFIAAAESGAHPQYVEAVLRATAADTVITEAFSATWPNAPHRVLKSCIEAANQFSESVVAEMELAGSTLQIVRFASAAPTRTTRGAIEAMPLYAGESVSNVNRIQPAAEIVAELMGEG